MGVAPEGDRGGWGPALSLSGAATVRTAAPIGEFVEDPASVVLLAEETPIERLQRPVTCLKHDGCCDGCRVKEQHTGILRVGVFVQMAAAITPTAALT